MRSCTAAAVLSYLQATCGPSIKSHCDVQEHELDKLDVNQLRQFLNLFIHELANALDAQIIFDAATTAWERFEASAGSVATLPGPSGGPAAAGAAAQPAPPQLQAAHFDAAVAAATQHAGAGASAAAAPPPVQPLAAAPPAPTQYQLRFSHNCQAQSCSDPNCPLCQHNPIRRCHTNLREAPHTYTVDEVIHAPCGAMLQIGLYDSAGVLVTEVPRELRECTLLLAVVDDRRYRDTFHGATGPDSVAAGSREQTMAPIGADRFLILQGTDGAPLRRAL